jgi:hypothetical protein
MSDGGRGRASLGVGVWKSSQNVDAERSAVRSIAWLDVSLGSCFAMIGGAKGRQHEPSAENEAGDNTDTRRKAPEEILVIAIFKNLFHAGCTVGQKIKHRRDCAARKEI